MWLKDIDKGVALRVSLDFHKVPYSPKSYATPELILWSALAICGFKQACLRCSPSWRQIIVVTWHLQSVTRTLFQKTTCRHFPYAILSKRIGVMVCKNRHILTAPEHLLTAPEDLKLFRKTYNCYGRLITVPEDLITAPEHLPNAPEHLLTAPEHFRNCSGALS